MQLLSHNIRTHEGEPSTMSKQEQNTYALVHPINSLRVTLSLLDQHKLNTDIKIKATAHAQSIQTHREPKPEIDADYLITSQPTLVFHGKQWLKPHKVLDAINRLQIPDVPIEQFELILPSVYDGKRHRTTFAILNTHSRMFKKMVSEGKIPYRRLMKICNDFMQILKERTSKTIYRHLKRSVMIMVDVNPGKNEMYNKEFVIGLKQPFMRKVVSTHFLWNCTDYEVF